MSLLLFPITLLIEAAAIIVSSLVINYTEILPLIGGHSFRTWTIFISIPSIILALTKPGVLLHPYRAWMKLGHILGWVNSRIILGLVFLIVLQPIAIIMRILGHDSLRTKKFAQKSYREIKTNHKVNLKKIF